MNMHRISPPAAKVQVTDWSLWVKHIKGDPELATRLEVLPAGEVITLRIGGHEGVWEKKADGKDGRPTPGLKPLGVMKQVWFDWFESKRGALVEIEAVEGGPAPARTRPVVAGLIETGSAQDREAAWAAFLALRNAGWRFAPAGRFDRDALHARGAS